MKGLIVNVLVGAGLFAGGLVGALAATGRLNHDGVANIPVLSGLFPAPPVDPNAAPPAGEHGAEAAGGEHGKPTDAQTDGEHAAPADAAHDKATTDGGNAAEGEVPQGQDPPASGQPLKRGRSLFQQEQKGGGEHGGGEHGGGEEGGGHGEAGAKKEHGGGHEAGGGEHAEAGHEPAGEKKHAAERDFDHVAEELAQDRASRYAPGGYFRFDGMPSGITPEKLNEAWRKVQEVAADLDKREQAMQLRDKELREFADDIARRQTEIGKERVELETMQRQLDERIELFQQQVKLVRTDEVAGLTRNAKALESFEPSKVVELITEQWKTESGQDEVLKTLEFMDKEKVNAILAAMPNKLITDVLQKRLKVSREPVPPAGTNK